MSQYIYLSLANQLIIQKDYKDIEIENKLNQYFCLKLYNKFENKENVIYCLKDEFLEKYLYDFLEEQADFLMCSKEIKQDILKLKNKSSQEMLYMIRNNELDYIHYLDFDFCKHHYFLKNMNIYIEGIIILSEGKILIECYEELFSYIHKIIRQGFVNPLKDATYLTIA